MGWFWDDEAPTLVVPANHPPVNPAAATPPPGCPMHKSSTSITAFAKSSNTSPPRSTTTTTSSSSSQPPSACPVRHKPAQQEAATTPSSSQSSSPLSTLSALNPLNNMPLHLSQQRESEHQTIALSTIRETSSIPRRNSAPDTSTPTEDDSGNNWIYPSPQQMYNAMVRKGFTDTPQDAVESMVAVHNFLNEGAWAEIVEWERRFSRGLLDGWKKSAWGEEGSWTGAMIAAAEEGELVRDSEGREVAQPTLLRFEGRSDAVTPKARMLQVMGWVWPGRYGGPMPFDRHDWYVERTSSTDSTQQSATREVRYIIDYYSAPPEPTGEPVFYLDIRPALDRPGAAAERLIRWGRDAWWRASGGSARERERVRRRMMEMAQEGEGVN